MLVGPSASNKVSYRSPCNLGTMSDQESERPRPARPASPPPAARGAGAESEAKRAGHGRGRRGGRGRGTAEGRPTPARALGDSDAPEAIPVEETAMRTDDVEWMVRVRGRSGGQSAVTPLLLLGFWRVGGPGDTEAAAVDGDPDREALVAATSLAQLGDEGLRTALAASKPPTPPTPNRSSEQPARSRRRGRGRR